MFINTNHPKITINRQCDLLGLSRSSRYYRSRQSQSDVAYNEQLMRMIDRQYTVTPFFGVRQMTYWLTRQGHTINVKRVRRLMRLMGLEPIYPKPRLIPIPTTPDRIWPAICFC